MKLERFNRTERLFHWAFALPMTLLAASGLLMVFVSLSGRAGAKEMIRSFHLGCGAALLSLPLLVYLLGDRRAINDNLRHFASFSADDRRWLKMNFLSLIRSGVELPPEGKFNGGQKMNALMMMTLTTLLAASGLTMALSPGALGANIVHVGAFSVFFMLFCGHLFLALINPSTRPAFRGIVSGKVPADWLRHHHVRMYEDKQRLIFDNMVMDHADRRDRRLIFSHFYQDAVDWHQFKTVCRNSAAMLVVRRDDQPAAFLQVVGDGVTCGVVVRFEAFVPEAQGDDFQRQCLTAASYLLGFPLGCRPALP